MPITNSIANQGAIQTGVAGLSLNLSKQSMALLDKMSREEQDVYNNYQRRIEESNRASTHGSESGYEMLDDKKSRPLEIEGNTTAGPNNLH